MTEAEWLEDADLLEMVRSLSGRVSERKLRVFAATIFRRLAYLLPEKAQQEAIDVLEQMAEGTSTFQDRKKAVWQARHCIPADTPATWHLHYAALMLYREFACLSPAVHAAHAGQAAASGNPSESQAQRLLLHDIVGNPFRPAALASEWRTSTVSALGQTIYTEYAFDRLPILADALEDAGCANADILDHCRGPGPHVRGCWLRFVGCQHPP